MGSEMCIRDRDRADPAGVVEDALSERRLPRVNVRRDADVAHALEGVAGGGGERARGKPSHPSAVRRSRAQPHAQHAALPTRAPDAATEEGGETRKNHTRNALVTTPLSPLSLSLPLSLSSLPPSLPLSLSLSLLSLSLQLALPPSLPPSLPRSLSFSLSLSSLSPSPSLPSLSLP